jgi:hypothetical protein
MKHWSFYELSTGRLTGAVISMSDESHVPEPPDGCGLVDGVHDYLSRTVDLGTGEVVDWVPPKPEVTDCFDWTWDQDQRRWICVRLAGSFAEDVRAQRTRLLTACDWVVTRAAELQEPVPADWLQYREALRDIPLQQGFPHEVVWPTAPSS